MGIKDTDFQPVQEVFMNTSSHIIYSFKRSLLGIFILFNASCGMSYYHRASTSHPSAYPPPYSEEAGRDEYQKIEESDYKDPQTEPLSTFSIDVDTASYANMRRFLHNGQLPPKDAVRI